MAFLNDIIKIVPKSFFGFSELQIETFGVFVLLLSVFIFMLISLFQDVSNEIRRPHVVPDISRYASLEDVVYDWRMGKSGKNQIKYKTKRYYLPYKQSRSFWINLLDTDPVNAVVTYYNESGEVLPSLSKGQAFWFDDKPRARSGRQENVVVIRKSGRHEGICLVIKDLENSNLYAFNHQSYIPGTGDFNFSKDSMIKLVTIYVKVHISDGNFERDDWVKITHRAKQEDPLFQLVKFPLMKYGIK
jgi:hypothetical protein